MALHIEQLMTLADRLDEKGQYEEADKIDAMVEKFAGDLFPTPEGAEKNPKLLSEEDMRAKMQARLEKLEPEEYDEAVAKESIDKAIGEIDWSEHKNPGPRVIAILENMRKAGWQVFSIGELEHWIKEEGFVSKKWRKTEKELKKQELEEGEAPELPGVITITDEDIEEVGAGEAEALGETQIASVKDVFDKLANIADRLDKLGATEEASLVDGFIQKYADDVLDYQGEDEKGEQSKRYDSKYHHSLQIREPKTEQERIDREGRDKHHIHTMQSVEASALSTRYCPDHIGVSLGRIGDLTYQCPLDGAVYNWETGWTDFDGKEHPGGSVAAQTPDSSGYAIPHRLFDSRENILNRVT